MPELPDGRHRRAADTQPASATYPMRYLPGPRPPVQGERPGISTWRPPYASRGRSRWHWLLLVPIAVPLTTPLYDRLRPELFGVPFFYWCQIAFIPLTMAVITLVNVATRKRD
jgi:hypothetical protein